MSPVISRTDATAGRELGAVLASHSAWFRRIVPTLVGIHPGGLLFTKCLVGIFCFQALPPSSALAAGDAHGYEDWSNTDVSHMWRPPQAKTARHHLASTPTGDATMSIPIVVPRSRFSPSLAIVYSGQGGNDRYFGEGWRLNLPVITREKKWVS